MLRTNSLSQINIYIYIENELHVNATHLTWFLPTSKPPVAGLVGFRGASK